MASHRAKALSPSINAYSSTTKETKGKKSKQAVLHQANGQRPNRGNRPALASDTNPRDKDLTKTPQARKEALEEDGFIDTNIMRVVLSGMQKEKKKGQRILSFVALIGACIVVGVYLIIPIMICLHITDTILAALIAALILTFMEGIVGLILMKIGTSHELVLSRQTKASSHLSASSQHSATPAFIPIPAPPSVKSSVLPALVPAAPGFRTPERNVVGMVGRQTGTVPVTDPIRLADIAQAETIRVNPSRTAVVPPLLKLPASS